MRAPLTHRSPHSGSSAAARPVEFDNSIAFVVLDPDGHPIEIIQWHPDASPYRVPSSATRSV